MEFPVYSRSIRISDGCGYVVRDDQGKEYIDLYGGHAVAALGYRHPALTSAIQVQAAKMHFQSNAVELEIRDRAVNALASIAPANLDSVLLVNSGSEANENALRLAFQHTSRKKVVCLGGAFHGRTAAAAVITDHSESWYGFPNKPFESVKVAVGDIQALDAALDDETAAFIFESVQGVAGAIDVPIRFLETARELCSGRGIVMIADEVQTGMGRTGYFFDCERTGVIPDLLTTAKGLGGGFPAAAVLAPASMVSSLPIGSFGTTFGGGPLACAAIEATIQTLSQPGFLNHVRETAAQLRSICIAPWIEKTTGAGFLIGIHANRPAKDIRHQLLEKGFVTGDAKDPHVVRLLPPLILDSEAVELFGMAIQDIA